MVGFGGGSSYNALLVLADADYQVIPVVALVCNIVVVTGGVFHFRRAGFVKWSSVLPFAAASVPLAVIGGALTISEDRFVLVLGLALLASGFAMLWPRHTLTRRSLSLRMRWLIGLPVGAMLGLLAGIVGIGGGIFLAPLMHLWRWDRAKVIAASASVFILINSIAGLLGQFSKWQGSDGTSAFGPYVFLPLAVLVAGQLGSYLGSGPVSARVVRALTAVLVVYVAIKLLVRATNY